MRKNLFLTTLIVVFFVCQLAAQQQPYIHGLLSQPRGSVIKSPAGKTQTDNPGEAGFSGQSGTGANINVVYHRVDWTVDPRSLTHTISGTVVTYFKTIAANVSNITMDLNNASFNNGSLQITYHGTTCSKSFTGNIVSITLPVNISAINSLDSFVISYAGVPPVAAGAAQGYQKSGTAPNQYTGSLSESYEDRDWWPCKADMQDKIDSMDINVTVPWNNNAAGDTFWVATNGRLYDSTINGPGLTRTFKFKTRYPITSYLVTLSVGKFTRYYRSVTINGTVVPVAYYILRNTTNHATKVAAMDKINPVVDSLSRRWGDYPFKLEKHGFYDGLVGAGGMEHQTFSAMASGSMASLSTLNHELAHQWFGDNVSFATWNDLWLAEGPARFAEAYAAEKVPVLGYSAATVHSMKTTLKSNALAQLTESAWIPNASMSTSNLIWNTNYGTTVYERGGMVITMLRALAGEAKFNEAMTSYQTALAGKSATTDSLKNHFNAALGTDINEFFRDYVGGSGSAALAVGGIGNPINNMGWNSPATNKLVLKVNSQTRTTGNNVSYFNGPVAMHFTNALSGWTKDTTIIIYDWGGGNLSYAGNGLSDPIPGNALNFDLSFTPTHAFYDDSAKTMSTGTMNFDFTFMGYSWNGATSGAWNTSTNWANCCAIPPTGAQVTIATTVNQPNLPGTITVGGLFISAGSKVNIGNNTLVINGLVTGTGTITGSSVSSIIINDAAGTLNFDQTSAATGSLNNFTINSGGSAVLGSAVDVYGTISLSGASLNLNAKNLTLKSTATATARIANLTGSTLTGATNVTVERYISDIGKRAWRLVTAPVTGAQTIRQSWQENGITASNLGVNITSPLYTVSNGFDALSGSSSILTHIQGGASGPSWSGTLANTNSTLLSAYPAYMLFIRGDRFATGGNSLRAPTVLRVTGTIKQGTQSPVVISATGTGYTLVGNPYPSPIDFETIAGTANLNPSYYLWDATLAGTSGVGGYRFVQRTAPNTYQQTPVLLGGPVSDPTIRYIHSGQGFFLKATGANASVVFTEASKAASISIVNPIVADETDQQLIANLMLTDANGESLADGIRVRFDKTYSADIDDDALKIGNFGANLASYRNSKSLIVEKRPLINGYDTIFLRTTNMGIKKYRFQIGTIDFLQRDMNAWLKDNYLGTNSPVDLTGAVNEINFSVTAEPASAATDRFMIVFAAKAAAPMSYTGIKAYKTAGFNISGSNIEVEWNVANQFKIEKYEVERSADGYNFGWVGTVSVAGANNNAGYHFTDTDPFIGDNFFRIRSVSTAGEIKYSEMVHVKIEKVQPAITIYPNPVINHSIGLQLAGLQKGNYQLRLLNTMGQVIFTHTLFHNGTNAAQTFKVGKNISSGYYSLEVVKPGGGKIVKAVYISK